MPVERVELSPRLSIPPELVGCDEREWNWDSVGFKVGPQENGKGCVLEAVVHGSRVKLAAEARTELPGDIKAMLLPRSAGAAAALRPAADALLLASVSRAEWASPAWLRLRQQWAGAGVVVLATAVEGELRLRVDSDGRVRRAGNRYLQNLLADLRL